MTADTVHTIFRALPQEEQIRLYGLISTDIKKNESKKKPRKKKLQLITDEEIRNLLLEKAFKVVINKT